MLQIFDYYYYPLPSVELNLYIFIWTIHSFAAFFIAMEATTHKVGNWLDHWLEASSYINGLRMDNSDMEWKLFRLSCKTTILALLLHSVIFKIALNLRKRINKSTRSSFLIFFWLVLHATLSSPGAILLLAAFAIISVVSTSIIKRQWFVWTFSAIFVSKITDFATFSTNPANYYREFNLYLYSTIKIVTLCLYIVKNKPRIDFGLAVQFCEYILYPPYATALIILFEDFQKQMDFVEDNGTAHQQLFSLETMKSIFRLLFWSSLLELLLHLCSVNALFNSPFTMLKTFNSYEAVSIAYVAGQLFHLKYTIIFGLPSLFAKLDGMTPPEPPICISRVSNYSDMWRYFDRGLYNFLKTQVYVPLIHQSSWLTSVAMRRVSAMFSVFLVVLIWHGVNSNYFFWICLSFLGLFIEKFAIDRFYSSHFFKTNLLPFLSVPNFTRLKAVMMLATVIPGVFGSFFFLGRSGVGSHIFREVLVAGFIQIFTLDIHFLGPGWVMLHLLLLGYAFNHVCLYIEQRKCQSHCRNAFEKSQ